jgi:tRNA(fMet)-specific endonuclease VapC
MRRYLLDTNTAADWIEKRRSVPDRAVEANRRGDRIGIGIPVLAELYFGAENSHSKERSLQQLRSAVKRLTIWPFDGRAAAEFGRLAAELRRRGRPMQVMDVMIAAIALTLGNCTVVSSDSDFAAIPELPVENWR